MIRTLLIIPTYNERENLTLLCTQIHDALPAADLLIVDDNSPDGTGELADSLAAKHSYLKVMHRAGKFGLAPLTCRLPLRHRPRLRLHLRDGRRLQPRSVHLPAPLGGGRRRRRGHRLAPRPRRRHRRTGGGRQLISAGGSLYARTILGLPIRDPTSGFGCFRRAVLDVDRSGERTRNGYSFQIEMTYRAIKKGFRVVEVPIVFVDRRAGQSKMSRKIFWRRWAWCGACGWASPENPGPVGAPTG